MAVAIAVRPALAADRHSISSLIYFESHVHRHLDWRTPLDWLGSDYYWVVEKVGRVVAALCCAPDPTDIGWIRLFACSDDLRPAEAWQLLWPVAWEGLGKLTARQAAAIVLQDWFSALLISSGFEHTQDIIVLDRDLSLPVPAERNAGFTIRSMLPSDLVSVAELDSAAFAPLWQNSAETLGRALDMSGIATVAETRNGLLAYQITTLHNGSGHLARLAVHPNAQRRGVAFRLVSDMLVKATSAHLKRVTVNTQNDNRASLALYAELGFHPTGETYAVYSRRVL